MVKAALLVGLIAVPLAPRLTREPWGTEGLAFLFATTVLGCWAALASSKLFEGTKADGTTRRFVNMILGRGRRGAASSRSGWRNELRLPLHAESTTSIFSTRVRRPPQALVGPAESDAVGLVVVLSPRPSWPTAGGRSPTATGRAGSGSGRSWPRGPSPWSWPPLPGRPSAPALGLGHVISAIALGHASSSARGTARPPPSRLTPGRTRPKSPDPLVGSAIADLPLRRPRPEMVRNSGPSEIARKSPPERIASGNGRDGGATRDRPTGEDGNP